MNHTGKERSKVVYEERRCSNPGCNNKFFVPKRKSNGRRFPPGLRPRNAKTCSKQCSAEYTNYMKKNRRTTIFK